jgi:hypothetical protein
VLVAVLVMERIERTPGFHLPMLCDVYIFANGSPQEQLFSTFRFNGITAHASGILSTVVFPAIVGPDVPFNLPGTQPGHVKVLRVMIP